MSIGAVDNHSVAKPSTHSKGYGAHIAYDDENIKKKNIHGTEGVHLTPAQQNVSVFC